MPRHDGNTRRISKGLKRRMDSQNMRRYMAKREAIFARLERHNASVLANQLEDDRDWELVKQATGWGTKPPKEQKPYPWSLLHRQKDTLRSGR